MTITVEALIAGSKAIQQARDEIRCFLAIMKPICLYKSLISDKFTPPDTERKFWWEVRRGDNKSFFQLWELIKPGDCERYWEGFADDVPPTEKVILVRSALPSLLESCVTKIDGCTEQLTPYLLK